MNPLACVLLIASPFTLVSSAVAQERVRYDDNVVVRTELDDLRELRTMLAIGGRLWSESLGLGTMDFMLETDRLDALDRSGIDHEILIPDVQMMLDSELERIEAFEGGIAGGGFFDEYHQGDDILAFYDGLAAARPDLMTGRTIGLSVEGRPIRAYTICGNDPATRPAMYVNTGAHAREWIGPATVAYFADTLINGHGSDARITDLVDGLAWHIVPLANPDGYAYTWSNDRLWRKNRRNNGDGTSGVDWNRNFSANWGGPGSSGSTSSDIYRGPAPFSEPETQALRDDMLATPNLAIFLDVHCYSQLVLWPYGYDESEPAGPAGEIHRAIGLGMAAAIASVNGVSFDPQAAHDLYIASGTSLDWGWDEAGAYSFTYELRDTGNFGFVLPPEQIIPSGEEILESLLWTGEQVLGAAGVTFISPLPTIAAPDSTVTVEVSILSAFAALDSTTATLVVRSDGADQRVPMDVTPSGDFTAQFTTGDCGTETGILFEIETTDGILLQLSNEEGLPWNIEIIESTLLFEDDVENDNGWTLGVSGDDATTGIWVRVDPNGTDAQPENDDSDPGTTCFVTGQGSVGGTLGENDVDGGRTTLVSPAISLIASDDTDRAVVLSLWYSNDTGADPNTDSLLIEASWDGGDWNQIADVTQSAAQWRRLSLPLPAPTKAPSSVRIRVIASDLGAGSVVEAGIDEISVIESACPKIDCPADLNQDGQVNGGDVGLLLAAWGEIGSGGEDLDGDGTVGGADIGLLLAFWGDC